jgi:hypothetical protein
LLNALFGIAEALNNREHPVCHLRYQLVHGAAATFIYAGQHQAKRAAFIVHEFWSLGLSNERLDANAKALASFVACLAGEPRQIQHGELIGPFRILGGGRVPGSIPLFIGKVRTALESLPN